MNFDSKSYSRGELASLSGLNPETIRYYERIGLLPQPKRGDNNYRIYCEKHLNQLRFVRRARNLGFEIRSIRELLDEQSNLSCSEVKLRTLRHIKNIDRKIAELKKIKKRLNELVMHCDENDVPICPIYDVLSLE